MSNQITPKEALKSYVEWLDTQGDISFGEDRRLFAAIYPSFEEFEAFNPGWRGGRVVHPVPTYFSPSGRWYAWEVKTIHLPWIRLKRMVGGLCTLPS